MYNELRDWAGEKINGHQINIDIVGACCLACPSCAVGSLSLGRKGVMTIDTFRRILDKAQSEFKIRRIQMYAYSDPCLHKDLHLFVQECTDRGIKTWLSSMLQTTKCDFAKVIEARPTEMRISFPGWEQMAYFQRGAKPEIFDRKIEEVAALPRYPETKWNLAFHYYRTNGHEENRARELAARLNLNFVRLPAIHMVLENYVEDKWSDADRELMKHLWETPDVAASRMKRTPTCKLWGQVTLNANGDVYLCQLVAEERFKLVNFLDYPYKAIRKMIKTHDFCTKCLDKGGNVIQFCYSEMDKDPDPIGTANRRRRL